MPDMGYDGNRTNAWIKKQLHSSRNRGRNVKAVVIQEKKDARNKKNQSEDSIIRIELQTLIRRRLGQGYTKEQILDALKSDEKFAKFSTFFESYIDNYLKKDDKER